MCIVWEHADISPELHQTECRYVREEASRIRLIEAAKLYIGDDDNFIQAVTLWCGSRQIDKAVFLARAHRMSMVTFKHVSDKFVR